MRQQFKVAELIQKIGQHVTSKFKDAGLGTTSTIVGNAREQVIRGNLQELLAGNNRVTTGVVIDSFENASQQTDIIIHEADFCPIFKIGGTEGEEYIPCEGVWAAGEVKSRLRAADLRSIFDHSKSIRRLRRYARPEQSVLTREETVCYRSFGVGATLQGTEQTSYDQGKRESDRIFTFGIVGKWDLSESACRDEFLAFVEQHGVEMAPNVIMGIDNGMLLPATRNENGSYSPETDWSKADAIAVSKTIDDRWRKLVGILNLVRSSRRTVAVEAYNRYTSLWGGIRPFTSGLEGQTIGKFEFFDLE